MIRLVLATRNPGKVKEIGRILSGLPVEIKSLVDYPSIAEIEETGATFAENAIIKARHVAREAGELALADDSGLEVDALGGQPGIRSSRFAGPGATDAQRNEKLLGSMKDAPDEKRTARFRCAAALASPNGDVSVFDGVCEGLITRDPKGEHGFGYDPIFFVPQFGKTMAELPPEVKNRISHRAKAIAAAREEVCRVVGL